ncbi:hypothetical protein [Vulcanisaeta souniana]|uniref:hypothetical protein n=1 Tax=Vulcanisaeta souniana TaxID=164452 RepID=UPI000B18680C|nr:hypothetical protein [Vulcanisaeta souniana]
MVSRRYRVFGTMVHGLLGSGSPLTRNLFHEIGITDKGEIKNYYRVINTNGWKRKRDAHVNPRIITITSTMTGEGGKTLITSALAYCLSRTGHYVGVAKLGGDIRDLHPGGLYILGKPFKPWMSIRMRWGGSRALGWFDWQRTLGKAVEIGLDTLLVEGVMGLLTGSSRRPKRGFSSTLDFIRQVNTDVVLIASAHYDGVEGALLRLRTNIDLLNKISKGPGVVVLNNAYHGIHEDRALRQFKTAINKLGISLFVVDSLMISSKPEELIDLEDYRDSAIKVSGNLCDAFINVLSK